MSKPPTKHKPTAPYSGRPSQPNVTQVVEQRQEVRMHQGPLPAPDDLLHYDKLFPGAAERIFVMAETEQHHRIAMERQAMDQDHKHRDEVTKAQAENVRWVMRSDLAGQALGGLVALAAISAAVYSIWAGAHWAVTVAFVSLPVAAIIKAVRANNKSG